MSLGNAVIAITPGGGHGTGIGRDSSNFLFFFLFSSMGGDPICSSFVSGLLAPAVNHDLPAMGVISELIPTLARKSGYWVPLSGRGQLAMQ